MNKIISTIKQILFEGNIFISRKTVRILCQIVLPFILLIISFFSYYIDGKPGLYEFSAEIGNLGFYMFAFILFISPLRIILPEFKILTKLLAYRRQLGIATFYIIAFHGIGLSIVLNVFSQLATIFSDPKNTLTWGIIALFLLFLAYITSNNLSIKFLRKNWRRVQKLVYPAFFFTIIHVTLIEKYSYMFLLIIYVILKLLAAKKVQIKLFDIFKKQESLEDKNPKTLI